MLCFRVLRPCPTPLNPYSIPSHSTCTRPPVQGDLPLTLHAVRHAPCSHTLLLLAPLTLTFAPLTPTLPPRVNYYDKDLFTGVAANVSANFTKYETEQLLKLLSAFHTFNHYDQAAFDDIADSITYCNHYLAPIKACPTQLATAFTAYAKHDHVRGDLFVSLARCGGHGRGQGPELWAGCCMGGCA